MSLIWLTDHRSPIGSDTSRAINTVGAVNRWFPVSRRLVDDRGPVGSDTSRSIDAVDARGGMGLLGESERTKRNYDGEHHVFHFKDTVRQLEQNQHLY